MDLDPTGIARNPFAAGALGSLVGLKFAPGASLRPRALPADQESLIVDGELYFGRRIATQGDYQIAPAGRPGPELASDLGAVIFVRSARVT